MKDLTEKTGHVYTLALIMAIGVLLRYYDLGTESIWIDEAYSINYSKLSINQILKLQDDFPPLYYLLLHSWIKLFGDTEVAVRFPSLILGVLSIAVIYRIGSLLFDVRKGLIAAYLLALSTFHIHHSQDARPYSLTILLGLLSMLFFIQCQKQLKTGAVVGYIISSTLLIYSHVIGGFLLAAQNVYVLTLSVSRSNDHRIRLTHWLMMQGAVGLLFLPWIPTFVTRTLDDARSSWLTVPGFHDIRLTLRRFSGPFLVQLSAVLALASFISLKALRTGNGWRAFFKSLAQLNPKLIKSDLRQNFLLLFWLVFPIAIPFLLSQLMTPLYCDRYAILSALALYLLVASGIGNLQPIAIRLLAIGFFTLVCLFNVNSYYRETTREEWRDVVQHIQHFALPEDMLIFNAGDHRNFPFNYYFDQRRIDTIVSPPGLELVDEALLNQWIHQANRHERV